MFYETFCRLCLIHGLTPSGAATKIGFNRASVTMWKNTGKAPKQELLLKIADFFGVTTDYLLGYDLQEKIDSLAFEISQIKEEIRTASAERIEELEETLFVLEESYEDLILAQSLTEDSGKEGKKETLAEKNLSESEQKLIELFRKVPEDRQDFVMKMIEAAIESL